MGIEGLSKNRERTHGPRQQSMIGHGGGRGHRVDKWSWEKQDKNTNASALGKQ